jgi:asparagine synthase (glutamine-hydrolysing)
MCGIHGIVNLYDNLPVDPVMIRRMGQVAEYRGPDDYGIYHNGRCGLGMQRLAIIGVETGKQPFSNHDNTVWLVCNGEIYNHHPLRIDLQHKGHVFKTESDCETLIHAYMQHGEDFVSHLDGMFGFALWDEREQKLILGRDPIGIKPLYFYRDSKCIYFASELKSIISVLDQVPVIDKIALQEYLSLGYVTAPNTLLEGVKKIQPGHVLTVSKAEQSLRPYSQPRLHQAQNLNEMQWIELCRAEIEASVHYQMESEVPLGAFLSGGIDSSAVVAYMAKHSSSPVNTFSIGFEGKDGGQFYNELPYAKQVAELFSTNHREILVKPDIATLLPRLLWHMDEPLGDTAFITTYLVAKFAREAVTVILSGVGGDELFGGYRRYLGQHYFSMYEKLPKILRKNIINKIAHVLPSDRHSPLLSFSRYAKSFLLSADMSEEDRYHSYVQLISNQNVKRMMSNVTELSKNALMHAFDGCEDEDGLNRLFCVDLKTQLPDDLLLLTDKMTMAASVECRVPLLDKRLIDLSLQMPSSMKIRGSTLKYVMKEALKDVLPEEILYRKKRGFGAPMGAWIKGELLSLMTSILSPESIQARGLFDWRVVEEHMQLHLANKQDYTDHLLSLMNLEIWCRIFIDKQSPDDLADEIKYAIAA